MIYLPNVPGETTLSRWTGRPHNFTIDPIGVECFLPAPPRRRGLFGRRERDEQGGYLHVLVHSDLPSDRVRAWAVQQVAQLSVLRDAPDARGDELNRRTDEARALLADRDWVAATIEADGLAHAGSAYVVSPALWAAYVEIGQDRVAIVGRDVSLEGLSLRAATSDEARSLRTDALRV